MTDPHRITDPAIDRYVVRRRVSVLERSGGGSTGLTGTDPNALHRTLANSKGEILVATGPDLFVVLEAPPMDGSADGWVLTVDSSTATGLAWAAVPGLPSVVWNVLGYVTTRTYDANATSLSELVDVFGTLVMLDLTGAPPLGGSYTVSNDVSDKVLDANSCTIHEVADVLGTAIADLDAGTGAGTYTVTNYTERRDLDADIATLYNLADALCTLISDEGLA